MEKDVIASAVVAVEHLGYSCLKELQLKFITSFVAGGNVFAVLPTGYRKILCYRSPVEPEPRFILSLDDFWEISLPHPLQSLFLDSKCAS